MDKNNDSLLPTPVKAEALNTALEGYDEAKRHTLVQGFACGFTVGYMGSLPPVDTKNLVSANQNPNLVKEKLAKEIVKGRIAGPFVTHPFPNFRTSPIGLVAKKEPGKFRLIHHLSYPDGLSVNDGIPEANCHVEYQNIDHAVAHMKSLGQGCWMAKTDIAEAFRIVPLHPSQYHLFGIWWDNCFFYDKCLPMGCSASCKIFEMISTALHWLANNKLHIQHMTHILDDFLMVEKFQNSCKTSLDKFIDSCTTLGIPISPEKTFQPSQTLTFLGYELDSVKMEIRLPVDKLLKCQQLLRESLKKRSLTLKQLQSIIGTLNFACGAVVPGRPFLRRLINLTMGITKPTHFIRITKEAREDLKTWLLFLDSYNGRSAFLPDRWRSSHSLQLFSDAASTIGYGAFLGPKWFHGEWDRHWKGQSIAVLEFYPIILAVETWSEELQNQCIHFYTDNQALVEVINKQTCRDTKLMSLLRRLVLSCLKKNILFQARHLPGAQNTLADLLSRGKIQQFRQLAPHMHPSPIAIPPLPPFPN